jgi:hypothetical protein
MTDLHHTITRRVLGVALLVTAMFGRKLHAQTPSATSSQTRLPQPAAKLDALRRRQG